MVPSDNNSDLGPDLLSSSLNAGFQQLSAQLNSTLRSAMRDMVQSLKQMKAETEGTNRSLKDQLGLTQKLTEEEHKRQRAIKDIEEAEKRISNLRSNASRKRASEEATINAARMRESSAIREIANAERLLQVAKKTDPNVIPIRRGRSIGLMDVASDLNLPGISAASTVGKYAQAGMGGKEEGSGLFGGGLAGAGIGAMAGAAILAGGFTAMQGYKAFGLAHQMAPGARTALGQGARNWRGSLGQYGGYGGIENLQTLISLNQSMGGRFGGRAMHRVTDLANTFGLQREQVGAQAGSLLYGGGAKTGNEATEQLKRIMIEGIKGGMDRARITEFTQQVLGIQTRIYALTGANVASGVSRGLGALMAHGGGESFLHGPGMAALGGLDSMVSQAGHLRLQGPMMGIMLRAFGNKQGGVGGLYNFMKQTEGGLFGMLSGKKGQQSFLPALNRLFSETYKSTGGRQDIGNMLIGQATGLGMNQIEALHGVMSRTGSGKMSASDQKIMNGLKASMQDPMMDLLKVSKESDATLAKLASSESGLGAIIGIDKAIQTATQTAASFLEDIAGVIAPKSKNSDGDPIDQKIDSFMNAITDDNSSKFGDKTMQVYDAIGDALGELTDKIGALIGATDKNTHATHANSRSKVNGKGAGT